MSVIKKHVRRKIKERNGLQKRVVESKPKIHFVKEGHKAVQSQQSQRSHVKILEKASDWLDI